MAQSVSRWLNQQAWQPFAGVDLRSLAFFRVAIALTILVNIALYWPGSATFFNDTTGFFFRSEAMRSQSGYNWSLMYISNAPAFIHLFFLVYLLGALGMLFGYRTRLATIICWACSLSLRTRAGAFISLADTQLVILLFWGMFLPLGARFSVDAALRKTPYSGNHYASIASLALVLNVAYLYLFGALEKSGAAWVKDYDAIFYALSNIESTTPLAPYLLALGSGLKPLTMMVYYLELCAAILIFLPGNTAAGRMVVIPLLMVMHVGFALFLSIGIFPLVSLSGLVALLPAMFWETALAYWNGRKTRTGIVIYYDRDCEFCLKCCLIFRSLGLAPSTPIIPAQDDREITPIFERENSWVVRTHEGTLLTRWDAVSYVWRRSPLLFPLGYLFWLPGLRQLGNLIYGLIAYFRPKLATVSARYLPRHETPLYRPGMLTSIILALLALTAFLGNINNLYGSYNTWPKTADMALRFAGLDQRWNMYAPVPMRGSSWLAIEGTTEHGDKVDVMHASLTPPNREKPHHGWELFPDFRWRKYFSRINWQYQGWRVLHYYCEQWNSKYPDVRLKNVEFLSFTQDSAPGSPVNMKSAFKGECPKPKN